MKRKLGKTTVNPLDLLLDTTSNVFGSMILIAIMIALFAGNPSDTGMADSGVITKEAIERQIANAKKDASALTSDLSKLKAKSGEKVGASNLAQIESDIDSVKRQLETEKKSQRAGIADAIVDLGATAAGASRDAATIEQEATQKQNAITSADQQIEDLNQRIEKLKTKLRGERAKKIQRISLPREKETSQLTYWVIFINGEVFPTKIYSALGDPQPFDTGITVIPKGKDSELLLVHRGKGYSLPQNKGDLTEQIRRLPRDHYVACLVFPDSIETFRNYEQIVHELGRDIGWQPADQENELVFSSKGSRPNPQ